MAVIKNIVQTIFTAQGAGQTASAANSVAGAIKQVGQNSAQVTKEQTRLGNASTNTGRAFAAQSQGLGGLVAAYAGAAATMFAMQQAYSALSNAAKAETMVNGTKTLALEMGQSGPKILKQIKDITQGQLTLAEASQAANIALSAGFNAKQLEGFTEVAMKASKALGRDFSDAMERITRGVAKLEPELLDELGIFTKLGPATEAYAKKLGVATSSLNEFQRRQAFATAAIEEGNRKFRNIDTTSASAQKSLEQLRVTITELATNLGMMIANFLTPFANFFSDEIGNSMLIFLGVLRMVFGKASEVIGGFISQTTSQWSNYFNNLSTRIANQKGAFTGLITAQEALNTAITKGTKDRAKGLSGDASFVKGLSRDMSSTASKFREEFIKQLEISPAEMKRRRDYLQNVMTEMANIEPKKGGPRDTSRAYQDAEKIIRSYDEALAKSGKTSKIMSGISVTLSSAITKVGQAAAFAGMALNTVFFAIAAVQLVGTLFDIDLLGKITGLFKDLSQRTKYMTSGMVGLLGAAAGGGDSLVKKLQAVGASEEYIENLNKKVKSVLEDARSAQIFEETIAARRDARKNGGSLWYGAAEEKATLLLQTSAIKNIESYQKAIEELNKELKDNPSTERREEILATKVVLEAATESIRRYGLGMELIVGQIAATTGMTTTQVGKALGDASGIINRTTNELSVLGISIEKVNGIYDTSNLASYKREIVDAGFLMVNSLDELRSAGAAGSLSVQVLEQRLAGLSANADRVRVSMREGITDPKEFAEAQSELKGINNEMEKWEATLARMRSSEDIIKKIEGAFGSAIKTMDSLDVSGAMNSSGKLATSQAEVAANQAAYLAKILDDTRTAYNINKNMDEIKKNIASTDAKAAQELENISHLTAGITADAEAHELAIKAVKSQIASAVVEAKKLTSEFSKQAEELNKATAQIYRENVIQNVEFSIDSRNLQKEIQDTLRNLQIEGLELDIDIAKARADVGEMSEKDAADYSYGKQLEIHALRVQAEEANYKNEQANLIAEGQLLLLRYNNDIAILTAEQALFEADVKSKAEYLTAQISTYNEVLAKEAAQQSDFISKIASVFKQGAASIASAILTQTPTEVTGAAVVAQTITDTTAGLVASTDALIAANQANTAAQIKSITDNTLAQQQSIEDRSAALDAEHSARMSNLAKEEQLIGLGHKKELQDIEKGGSKKDKGGADKAEKARQEMVKAILEVEKALKDAAKAVIVDVANLLGGLLTTVKESAAENAKFQEELATSLLAYADDKLSDVQSRLEDALSTEADLRESLKDKTLELAESYKTLEESLVSQEQTIKESSKAYVNQLLQQKAAIVELGIAGRKAASLDKQEKSLSEIQIDLQSQLTAATEARISAEAKLEESQNRVTAFTELLSGASEGLASSLLTLMQAMNAAAAMAGVASGVEVELTQEQKAQKLFGSLSGAVKTVSDNLKDMAKVGKGLTGSLEDTKFTMEFMDKAVGYVNAGLQGFSIGGVIGDLVGDTGVATQIGGAIGGIVGKILAGPQFAGGIATSIASAFGGSAVGTALGSIFTAAVPILGSIVGSLLGSIFKKTPRASATGSFGMDGFDIDTRVSKDGGKVDGIASLMESTYDGFLASLEEFGISVTKGITDLSSYIGIKKNQMVGIFYKEGVELFRTTLTASDEGAKDMSKFFIDSFLKAYDVGDLIVDKLMPGAKNLQKAVNYFGTLGESLRDTEAFESSMKFAQEFDSALSSMSNGIYTTGEAIRQVTDAAKVQAYNLSKYYNEFLSDTESTFGKTSKQYKQAEAAIRENALALIGLAEVSKGATTELKSLEEATTSVNAGAVMVANLLESIKSLKGIGGLVAKDIRAAIKAATSNLVKESNIDLKQAIRLLENPIAEVLTTIDSIATNTEERVKYFVGVRNTLRKEDEATAETLKTADKNVELAKKLGQMQIAAYIDSLSRAQLDLLNKSKDLTKAEKDLIDARLEGLKAIDTQEAMNRLIESGNAMSATLTELTGKIFDFSVLGRKVVVPTSFDLGEAIFGEEKTGPFIEKFRGFLGNIARGTKPAAMYSNAINLLNKRVLAGSMTDLEAAKATEELNSVMTDYLTTTGSLIESLEGTLNSLNSMIEEARNAVSESISNLGDSLTGAIETFTNKSIELLSIYDSTLKKVADSGNKLFDLQDKAKTAFEEAAQAVSDFEREHKLTGRTSAEVASELSSVQAELNSLLSKPVSMADFMRISELSSAQRRLSTELSTLTSVEREYNQLISERDRAMEDMSYAESTIISLGDQLIDTRRTESEIIQDIQDATVDFVTAQQDLLTITDLLADANFNLNQARFDEESAVSRTITALQEYAAAQNVLHNEISDILTDSESFIDDYVSSAVSNMQQYWESLTEAQREAAYGTSTLEEVLADTQSAALEAAQGMVSWAESAQDIVGSLVLIENIKPLTPEQLPFTDAHLGIMTDRFREFNSKLFQYLDTEGMSQFYGAGGIFEQFRDSLEINMLAQGVGKLMAAGGPLELLPTAFGLVYQSLQGLVQQGNFLDVAITSVKGSFGLLVSATGATEENVYGLSNSIAILGNNLDGLDSEVLKIQTALGAFEFSITSFDDGNAINILTSKIPEAISLIATNITLLGTTLTEVNISVASKHLITDITTNIFAIDSAIGKLTISGSATNLYNNIYNSINELGSGISNIVINQNAVKTLVLNVTNVITGSFMTIASGIANISILNSAADTMIANINTIINGNSNSISSRIGNIKLDGSKINTFVSNFGLSITGNANSIDARIAGIQMNSSLINTLVQNISTALIGNTNSLTTKINAIVVNGDNYATIVGNISDSIIGKTNSLVTKVNSIIVNGSNFGTLVSVIQSSITGNSNSLVTKINGIEITGNNFGVIVNSVQTSIIGKANSLVNKVNAITVTGDNFGAVFNSIRTSIVGNANSLTTKINGIAVNGDNFGVLVNSIQTSIIGKANSLVNKINAITISGDNFGVVFNSIKTSIVGNANSLTTKINSIVVTGDNYGALITAISNSVIGKSNSLTTKINSIVVNGDNFGTLVTTISNSVTGKANSLTTKINSIEITGSNFGALSTKVSNAVIGLATNVNSIASPVFGVLISTIRNSLLAPANSLQANINAITSPSFTTLVSTVTKSITSLTSSINTHSISADAYDKLVNSVKSSLTDTTKATSLLSRINALGSAFPSTSFDILGTAKTAINQLLNAVTVDKTTKMNELRDAIGNLGNITTSINKVNGLNTELGSLGTKANNVGEKVTTLTTNFTNLTTQLASLTGTDGSVAAAKKSISSLASSIESTFSGIKIKAPDIIDKASLKVSVTTALGGDDSKNLGKIATNTGKYPIIKDITAAGYSVANFATGGPVRGPGTGTSDSVNAKLSNGEYVVKADSVKKLGLDVLNELNRSGNLSKALAGSGRNGDSMVAHITPEEAMALMRAGGSGTINPKTGLREFFNADAGAISSMFAKQETNYLWNKFGSNISKEKLLANGTDSNLFMSATTVGKNTKVRAEGVLSDYNDSTHRGDGGGDSWFVPKILESGDVDKFMTSLGNAYTIANLLTSSRGSTNPLNVLKFDWATGQGSLSKSAKAHRPYYDWYKYNGMRGEYSNSNTTFTKGTHDWLGALSHTSSASNPQQRYLQSISKAISTSLKVSAPAAMNEAISKSAISDMVSGINKKYKSATDFYMLDKPEIGMKYSKTDNRFAQGFVNGGLVKRDQVPGYLEDGEFVLRKQAVNAMGLDAAIKLNSTGNVGEANVEVNIINNGTPQEKVSVGTLRKENGKLILDVVLDDMKNNGPITRGIKSLRNG